MAKDFGPPGTRDLTCLRTRLLKGDPGGGGGGMWWAAGFFFSFLAAFFSFFFFFINCFYATGQARTQRPCGFEALYLPL